jgi:hypothetical protein
MVIVGVFTTTGVTGTISLAPAFTTLQNTSGGAKATGSFSDQFYLGCRMAAGAPGGSTSDTSYVATFNAASWGTFLTFVLRSSVGNWTAVGSAEYHGNGAGVYSATCPDATYTPTSAANATVWGWGGQTTGVSGTSTLSGTGTTTVSNFAQNTQSGDGGVYGCGWRQSTSAPGGATSAVLSGGGAVDACDFAAEFAEVAVSTPSTVTVPGMQDVVGGNTATIGQAIATASQW